MMALSSRIAAYFTAFDIKGSDEYTELFCEPCQDDGDQIQAVGFCVDCSEYLCRECYRNHSKNRLSRSHLLQDETDMPTSKPESSKHTSGETNSADMPKSKPESSKHTSGETNSADMPTSKPESSKHTSEETNSDDVEECDKHKGHMFEVYCRSHEELGCGTCLFLKHRECKEIIHIEEEYKKFKEKIDSICSQIDVQAATLSNNRKEVETIHSKAIIDLNDFMTDIRCYIDTLEKDMKSKAGDLKYKENKRLDTTADTCLTLTKEFKTFATDIETLFRLNNNRLLFKVMENATERIKRTETTLIQISNADYVMMYTLEPEKQLQSIIETVKYLGKLRTNEKSLQSQDTRKTSVSDETRKSTVPTSIPAGYTGRRFSVYVGNLTWWTSDQDLADALNSIGVHDLLEIKICDNNANGQSKGFAIVKVGSEVSSRAIFDKLARKELNGQQPLITHCNKQALKQFETQARKGESPPPQKQNGGY